ncbi:GTP-binding protein Gtr1p [Trichomonascus vanleenenianus]|uniref:Rag GTPase GTR1 n=1 Tax=Trichomonascus vanleenenianus TaxID=2268995 RepID=UPI003ECAD52D
MAGPSSQRKKLLLMGRSGSGKSSMRSIIFSNYSAFDTRRLGATIDVEHSHLRFLGHMTLNLWDCGGQEVFIDNYFSTQRDHIFRMVEVLIYVFDVESKKVPKDIETFVRCLKHLREFSPGAKVFVLVHKMDLIQVDTRDHVFNSTMARLREASKNYGYELTGFATSIWDESLYRAWSSIVCSLIPNMGVFQKHLQDFASISEAQELVLFERTTFLVISHVSSPDSSVPQDALDPKRFEKISNIIKTYKQSCSKMRSQFQTISLHGHSCSAYIDTLTPNTFIMVVMPPASKHRRDGYVSGDIDGNTVIANIRASRAWFEKIELEHE